MLFNISRSHGLQLIFFFDNTVHKQLEKCDIFQYYDRLAGVALKELSAALSCAQLA